MAVKMSQYGHEMDKSKKGESLQERHDKAVKKSQVTSDGKKYDEEGLVKKTKRRMKELFYGDRTYLPGHKKTKPEKETRTTQVEGGLKQAGLSEKEINKLKGKK